MAYVMTPEEEKCWQRELEMTELEFLQQKLRNRKNDYFTEEREYMEERVAELKQKYREYCV